MAELDRQSKIAYHLTELLNVMNDIGNPYLIAIQLTPGRSDEFNGLLHSHLNGGADDSLALALLMVKDGSVPTLQKFMPKDVKLKAKAGDEALKLMAELEQSDIKLKINEINVPKNYHNYKP